MCWETYRKSNTAVRTAEMDIPVFKVVTLSEGAGKGTPCLMAKEGFFDAAGAPARAYRPGVTYRPNGFDAPQAHTCGGYSAERGFYSYSSGCRANWGWSCLCVYSPSGAMIDQMLRTLAGRRLAVMRCVIPAGSRYYLNEAGIYLSDALRVDGFEEAEYEQGCLPGFPYDGRNAKKKKTAWRVYIRGNRLYSRHNSKKYKYVLGIV